MAFLNMFRDFPEQSLFVKFDLPFFQSHFCWFNDMRNLDFFLFLILERNIFLEAVAVGKELVEIGFVTFP